MTDKPKRQRRTKAQLEQARRRREASHRYRLKTRHRMTVEQYEALLAFQGGHCYLCPNTGKARYLAVDHDHAKAKAECSHPHDESCENCWRGLLCQRCNDTLAHARDSREYFRRALWYLWQPPAQEWLVAQDD